MRSDSDLLYGERSRQSVSRSIVDDIYEISLFDKYRFKFEYGVDLDENLCYLNFELGLDFFIKQIRTLLKFNEKKDIIIICNTDITSISDDNAKYIWTSYMTYIDYIKENNNINIVLYCRNLNISITTINCLLQYSGDLYVIKELTTRYPDIQQIKNIKLI